MMYASRQAQVRQHDSLYVQNEIVVLPHDRFLETGCFFELADLHEENMSNVE